MSWSLVERGLEALCEADQTTSECRQGGRGDSAAGVGKTGKQRAAAKQRKQESKNQLIHKQVASALERYKHSVPKDRTVDNIKLLRRIDKKRAPQQYVNKILEHHAQELSRRGSPGDKATQEGKEESKEVSMFTDEDFEKLNKEWLRLY